MCTETKTCELCFEEMELEVLTSAKGYYLGYMCINHGPIERVSGYFGHKFQAEQYLEEGREHRARGIEQKESKKW